jgi:hypothetical protein
MDFESIRIVCTTDKGKFATLPIGAHPFLPPPLPPSSPWNISNVGSDREGAPHGKRKPTSGASPAPDRSPATMAVISRADARIDPEL